MDPVPSPKSKQNARYLALLAGLVGAFLTPVVAQEASSPAPATSTDSAKADSSSDDVLKLDSLVVTAVSAPGQTKMQSSVSVSSFDQQDLQVTVPRSTGEIFRNLPAIRVESSSGDGNLNLTARGLPITTGGSKYVQLQEDGLPILQFGDMSFATADQWLRNDYGVASTESVVGGSASTLATNAPGGIINFISNTGEVAGGAIGVTEGLDYGNTRFDLGYGGEITKDIHFYLSGFYREGEGPKSADYTANNGGQFKFNLTKDFANGYIRIYVKALDDRILSPLPVPMQITGSNSNPSYGSLPGFNALTGTLNTPNLLSVLSTTTGGTTLQSDVKDGIHTKTSSIGAEANFNLPGDWTINDKFRTSKNSGDFVDPYPADVDSAKTIATNLGGAGATLKYANGARVGQSIDPSTVNGNGLLAVVHMFNTQLNNFDNTFNDLKLNKIFNFEGSGRLNATFGLYTSQQAMYMDWDWNAYLLDVKGKDAALVDVYAANGSKITDGGLIAYGTNYAGGWGQLQRRYAVDYTTNAPYASLSYGLKHLTLEGSARRDISEARGYTDSGIQTQEDVNGNGSLSVPETNVSVIDAAHPSPVNYNWNFTSYSMGANYEFSKQFAAYARYSDGGSAGADRALFSNQLTSSGAFGSGGTPEGEAKQAELGTKYQTTKLVPGRLQLFATLFQAKVQEISNDITLAAKGLPSVFAANYKSTGFDVDGDYSLGGFNLRAALTYTHSKDEDTGLVPQRVPDWIYQLTPSYRIGSFTLGGALIGVTKSYSDNSDTAPIQPGYAYINLFGSYEFTKGLTVSLGVNNVTNTIGITEIDSGRSGATGNVISARSIAGRTTSVTVRYAF